MLEQMFGRNSRRMVEAAAIRRTEAGVVVEGFTAFTLRGDRWFPEAEWKPRSREEALMWLNGGLGSLLSEARPHMATAAGSQRLVQDHLPRQRDPVR
jgi:hypothetical protein